jgi:CDP-4-dehydro-6-deoxyglucose reductase
MALTFYNAEVTSILDEAPNVRRFFFKVPELQEFNFIPGQFTMLDLPIDCKQTTRAYSIASAPVPNSNSFELVIVLKPGGLGTTYLFDHVKEGQQMKVSAPLGKFAKPRPVSFDKDLCFICTGTGIAPFRSMLLDIVNYKIPHKKITLILGCRREEDILYRKEMEKLQEEIKGFTFIPVLSRAEEGWKGRQGYVHIIYEELFASHPPAQFYICGWKVMILQTVENLKAMGYVKEDIRYELYD